MANQRAEIDVVVNGGQAKSTLNEIAKAVDGVATSADKSSTAVSKIGDGADAGVDKAINATKRFEQQLKRLNLEIESGGKNTAAYIEGRAKLAGADTAALAPLIAQYDQIRAKQALANAEFTKSGKAMTEYGMGVKATSAALRQVPAQFTDIIVSLQGGQAPLTVLLQQGGQLKDVFGGVGNAFKALSGYVLGLINPFTAAAAVVGTLGYAYKNATDEVDAYRKALVMSGNAMGVSVGQLQGMAEVIGSRTNATVGAAAEALQQMAGSSRIAASGLSAATDAAIRFEKMGGSAIKETAKAYADLANDPVAASEKLNKQYNYLTASVYDQIKALAEQGDKTAAVSLAQSEFTTAQSRMATEMEAGLGRVEKAWNAAGKAAKGAWDEFVGAFRPDPIDKVIAELETRMSFGDGFYGVGGQDKAKIQEQLTYWKNRKASNDDYAAYQKRNAQQTEAQIVLDKAHAASLDKVARAQKEIAALSGAFALADQSPENIAKYAAGIQSILDKSKESAKGVKATATAISEAEKGLKLYNDLMDKGAGLTANFAEQQGQLTAKFAKDGNLKEYQDGMAAIIKQQPYMVASLKAEADAIAAIEKARNTGIQSHAKELESLGEKAQKLEDEVAMYGMSKEAIEELTTARMLDRIEVLKGFDNSAEEIARIEQTIAARKRLAAAGTAKDMADESAKAAKDMAAEQKKAAEASEKYWEDALMRAFESGKGFFQSLWDTIKNTLKTQVLKVTVQGVMGTLGLGASGAAMASPLGMAGDAAGIAGFGSNIISGLGLAATGFGQAAAATFSNGLIAGFSTNMANVGALASGGSWMTALGAAAPYLAIGAAVIGLITGNKKIPSRGTGEAALTYDTGGNVISSNLGSPQGGGLTELASGVITSMSASYFATAKQLGITAAEATFGFGGNTGKDSKGANFALWSGANGVSYSGSNNNSQSYTPEQLQLEASRAVFTALQASELPGYLSGLFDNITASTATQKQIDGVLAYGNALAGLNRGLMAMPDHFQQLAALSYEATQGLIGFSGGMEALGANLGTYYSNFYTAEEQRAQTIRNINAATAGSGLDAATATRAQFRSLVESQDLTTESGQKTYAALLGVAGAFAELTPVLDSVAAAIDANLVKMQESAAELAVELLAAQGDLTGAAAAQRALDTAGYSDMAIAAYDANTATRTLIDGLNAQAEAAASLAATNAGLQDQLDVLTGAQTERSLALRDAGDDSTRALMNQVYAQQDLKASADAAAQAAAALAQTNQGWQNQLDILTGAQTERSIALRDAGEESTRALMEQVYAQQDLKTAAEAAARAQEQSAAALSQSADKAVDAMKSLSDQMDSIATFRAGVGTAQQGIRSQMAGYDAVAYGKSQVNLYTSQLGAATTTSGRIEAGGNLQGAIVDRYNAELALINKNKEAASSAAQEAFNAQTSAQNAAISSANALNAAYRSIGDYAKGLLTGANAPFIGAERYTASSASYAQMLAGAQSGDLKSLQGLTGAADSYLGQAQMQAVDSVDYARIFGRTVNDLSALGGRAGADIESVQRQFYFDSSAFDAQALTLQTSTVSQLGALADMTDVWTADLQAALDEQALAFSGMGLSTAQTAEYTSKIEPGFDRVITAISNAQTAQQNADALLAKITELTAEVSRLTAISQKTADNTASTAAVLDSATGGGGPMLVTTA